MNCRGMPVAGMVNEEMWEAPLQPRFIQIGPVLLAVPIWHEVFIEGQLCS